MEALKPAAAAPGRRWPALARGAALTLGLAVTGVLLFGTVHALVIVPIWRRLPSGLPLALGAAAAMVWALAELRRMGRLPGVGGGALFGLLLWLAILPTTALGAFFRLSGLHRRAETLEITLEVAVAALVGALLGLLGERSWRAALAGAVVVATVVLVMGGPIPVSNGRRPRLLWLSFLPLYVTAGALLAAGFRCLRLTAADRGAP